MLRKMFKASLVLASGTIGGQLFVLAVSPLLTRLYGPADFGIFGAYAAALYILSAFSAFRYEVSIPLLKREEDAKCLAAASILLVAFTSTICFFLLFFVTSLFDFPGKILFQWVLPFGLLLAGIYNVLMFYQLRQGRYSTIARTRASQAVGGATFQIGAGFLGGGALGLIVGQVIGLSGGGVILGGAKTIKSFFESFSMRRATLQLRRQIDFARFGAPAALLQIANSHCVTLLLGFFFLPSSVGIYALVQRVSITPFSIVSAAISASLISFGNELNQGKGRRPLSMQSLLTAVMSPVSLLAAIALYFGFQRVFGSQWADGARISAWIVLIVSQKFIFDSVFSLTTTEGEQKKGLKLQSIVFLFRHTAFLIPAFFFDFETVMIIFSVASSVVYFIASRSILSSLSETRSWAEELGMLLDLSIPYLFVTALLYAVSESLFIILCILSLAWFLFRLMPVGKLAMSRGAQK